MSAARFPHLTRPQSQCHTAQLHRHCPPPHRQCSRQSETENPGNPMCLYNNSHLQKNDVCLSFISSNAGFKSGSSSPKTSLAYACASSRDTFTTGSSNPRSARGTLTISALSSHKPVYAKNKRSPSKMPHPSCQYAQNH